MIIIILIPKCNPRKDLISFSILIPKYSEIFCPLSEIPSLKKIDETYDIININIRKAKDVITGRIIFRKISEIYEIKMMALEIIKKERSINGNMNNEITLCKFEIMDGSPIKNEIIPIRFFLAPYELSPTYKNINNCFSVKYYINLVIYDIKDKRYYKQHEIILYRIPRIL